MYLKTLNYMTGRKVFLYFPNYHSYSHVFTFTYSFTFKFLNLFKFRGRSVWIHELFALYVSLIITLFKYFIRIRLAFEKDSSKVIIILRVFFF